MAKWSKHAEERMVERRPFSGYRAMQELCARATKYGVVSSEEVALCARVRGPRVPSGAKYVVAIIRGGVVVTVKTLSAEAMENEQKYKRVLS